MTIVVAHRTCPLDAPENSVEGIGRAAAVGAEVVEIDVRLSRDGVPVLHHDPWLWRVARRPYVIGWSRARTLRLPTLDDALTAAADAGIDVSIDVKDPRACDAVVRTVRAAAAALRVRLWAREREQVEVYAAEFPGTEVALLRETHDPAAHDRFLADASAWGATAVSGNQDAAGPSSSPRHASARSPSTPGTKPWRSRRSSYRPPRACRAARRGHRLASPGPGDDRRRHRLAWPLVVPEQWRR